MIINWKNILIAAVLATIVQTLFGILPGFAVGILYIISLDKKKFKPHFPKMLKLNNKAV